MPPLGNPSEVTSAASPSLTTCANDALAVLGYSTSEPRVCAFAAVAAATLMTRAE